jgi:hypothetical protein
MPRTFTCTLLCAPGKAAQRAAGPGRRTAGGVREAAGSAPLRFTFLYGNPEQG